MVNGPPCAVCGTTLRWIPQQTGWGCDRCQRMFPASGPGAPQQAQPQGFQPPQQQGFGAPQGQNNKTILGGPGFTPPQQQGFGAPQQRGFQPPQQQGFGAPQPFGAQPGGQPHGGSPNFGAPQAGAQPNFGAGAPNFGGQPGFGAQGPHAPPAGAAFGAPGAQPGSFPPGANPYAPGTQPPYGQPQPPYSPQPVAAAPSPQPAVPKKGGKGLIIGIAVAAVAIAGGVVAFVMMRGGGSTGAGGSRTEVVKATLSALSAGDVDRMLELADPKGLFAKVVDCEGKTKAREPEASGDQELSEHDKEQRDPNKVYEKAKKELSEWVPQTKGVKIELVEIVTKEPAAPSDDDLPGGDDRTMRQGDRLMRGCVAKLPVRMHHAKLKLKVTPPGDKAAIDQEAAITLMQVGTGFWVLEPPRIKLGAAGLMKEAEALRDKVCACKDKECVDKLKAEFKSREDAFEKQAKELPESDQKKLDKIDDELRACEKAVKGDDQATAAIEGVTRFKDKMCECKDAACADKVSQELNVWMKSQADDKLTPADLEKIKTISEELGKCMVQATGTGSGSSIGTTVEAPAADNDFPALPNMPPECEEYRKSLIKITSCPAFPAGSKAGIVDGYKTFYDAMKKMDAATMQTMVKTCSDAAVQMAQLSGQIGC